MPHDATSGAKSRRPRPSRAKEKQEPRFQPLKLEQMAPARAALADAFYRRHAPLGIGIAGDRWLIASAWPPAVADDAIAVRFKFAGAAGTFTAPRKLVEHWLLKADPDAALARLQPAHAALLVEMLLADDLAAFEAALDCRIEIETVAAAVAVPDAPLLGLRLSGAAEAFSCSLDLDDSPYLPRLKELFLHHAEKASATADAVPLRASLLLGATRLSHGEARSLRLGDVVLMDDSAGEAASGLLTIADRLVATIDAVPGGGRLTMRPRPLAGSSWEWIMNDTRPQADEALEDADLDDVPVALTFELGRTMLPLGDIRQLAPGAIVSLPGHERETVDVIANGKRIGQGEIVRIGESVGVRVVRVFDNAG
jgi:type III secretion protein Q